MKEPIIEGDYLINPYRRCIYCKGCEVINLRTGHNTISETDKGILFCTDYTQCERNLLSESNEIEVGIGPEGLSLKDHYGNEIIFKDDTEPDNYYMGPYDEEDDYYDDPFSDDEDEYI